MTFFVAAIISFVFGGGSGDYGSFELPFSHNTYTTLDLPSISPIRLLRVKKLSDNAVLSSKASPLFAGYDLSSAVETKIPARGKALVATDLSISIPESTYAHIAPRSGLVLKHSIDVGAGVIDTDYRRPIGVILFNQSAISDLLSDLGSSFLASAVDTACKANEVARG
nr:deoxyuridine 5'-triphosphate nucleotidohydrolase [Arachis hypogaea]